MSQGSNDVETGIASLELLDHHEVDWKRVQRTAYLVNQHLHYEYPGPIHDLQQTLIVVPPEQHGDQRRIMHHLEVMQQEVQLAPAVVEPVMQHDDFGNTVLKLSVPFVEKAIDFEVWIVVERYADKIPYYVPVDALSDPRLLEPSRLTQADAAIQRAATTIRAEGHQGVALLERINNWTYTALKYENGVTHIHSTAAQALALGRGVCQDFAHVMIALCRHCAIPARYVSGHLLGEGGTHAWVEVLVPSSEHPDKAQVLAFDPTHGREPGFSYLTVAVGRDYLDVAPTSGTFRASYQGQLSARKRVGLTALEYADE